MHSTIATITLVVPHLQIKINRAKYEINSFTLRFKVLLIVVFILKVKLTFVKICKTLLHNYLAYNTQLYKPV
jgi:hypothetical protein